MTDYNSSLPTVSTISTAAAHTHDNTDSDRTRQSMFWSITRATPVLVPFAAVVATMLDYNYLPFLVGTGITYIINQTLKHTFQYIYSVPWCSDRLTAIIGPGKRPDGSNNSSSFMRWPAKQSRTFGMPSGHSQTAWYLAGFIYTYLYIHSAITTKIKSNWKLIHTIASITIVTIFATLVSYSRVYIDKVHTIQQVIIGGIIGLVTGLICVPG